MILYTRKCAGGYRPVFSGKNHQRRFICIGQIAINPATSEVEATTIEEQTEQVCQNIGAILEAAGTDFSKVIKTTCFLKNMADFGAFNTVYGNYFVSKPARSCVAVAALPKDVLVEVEVIAEV